MNNLNPAQYANLLIPFCEAASVNYRNTDETLKKRIIISFMSFVEPENLHNSLFPQDHCDWVNVRQYLNDVHFATSDWIMLVALMDFSNEIPMSQQTQEMLSSALAGIQVSTLGKSMNPVESMKLCFAKAGISPTWDIICKALILSMISDIDLHQSFQYLLASTPATESMTIHDIIRHISTICKHSPKDYHEVFKYILNKENCHVRSHILLKSLDAREEAVEKKRISQLTLLNQSKKPSLTYILEMNQIQASANRQSNSQGERSPDEIDSFYRFCEISRFPVHANAHAKRITYYLKCLPKSSVSSSDALQECLQKIWGNDSSIMQAIAAVELVTPDIQALKTFLSETYYAGVPFLTLKHFFQNCIAVSSIQSSSKTMNWTTIFRLYISTYFRPETTKELWIHIISMANSQSEAQRDTTAAATKASHHHSIKFHFFTSSETEACIQKFVEEYPLNIHEITDILLSNLSPSSALPSKSLR